MSLINDMLNDLESRRANDLNRPGLRGEIRPLPRQERAAWLPWVAGMAVLAIVVGVGAFYLVPVQSKPPVAMPRVEPPPVPLTVPSAKPPANASAPEIQEALLESPPSPLTTGLRPSTSLSVLPQSMPPAAAKPAPALEPVAPEKARAAENTLATKPPKANAVVRNSPEVPGTIDKRNISGGPRERLEGEYRNAMQAAAAGRAGEAIDHLRDILRQDPTYSLVRQALLRILLEQRRVDEMMTVLSEGLDLQPNQSGWAISLARLLVERNDYAGAQRVLARSYSHAAANPDYVGFFAHVQYRQGNYRDAAELYQATVKMAPAEGRWWLGFGFALEADGRGNDAREAFRKALATGTLSSDLAALAEQKLR